jgi:hypothetical protein
MTLVLVLLAVAGIAWAIAALLRAPSTPRVTPPSPAAPPPLRPSRPASASNQRHFNGRFVPAPSAGTVPPESRPAASRMQNGRRVPSRINGPGIANGRTFIPDNAIGLGCLAPISECTLGDRCVCRGKAGQRRAGL